MVVKEGPQQNLEAELAVKSSLVDALSAENEQLRNLLQRHVDQAEVTDIKRFSRGDMRRESNINELQAALACMRSQLHDTASEYEEQKKVALTEKEEKAALQAKLDHANEEIHLLKTTILELQAKLTEGEASLEEEKTRVATLRTGLDESKRAIVILQEQNERRQSEAAAARRASLEAQGILPMNSATVGASASRKVSLGFPNVTEARRGSLNYLNGLGLATKRTAYFDSAKIGSQRHGSLADNSATPSEHEVLARRRASLPASGLLAAVQGTDDDDSPSPSAKSGMPTSASSPHLGATGPSRRPSLVAVRRSSIGYENSPTRRNSHLAHTLSRLGANGPENDLPMSRRGSRILANDMSGLSSLPEHGPNDDASVKVRRRSSLLVNPNHIRRPSDKQPPTSVADDPSSKMRKISERSRTTSNGDSDELVHALSLEAVMEIAALRESVEQLRIQLFESEEAREASETCARVLREFIASQAPVETAVPAIRLPPLPTEADELDTSSPNAKIKTDRSASDRPEARKTSSMWGIPKILPSLSYGTSKKDAQAATSASATDTVAKTFASISTDLLLPSRVADIKRRSSSISSRSEYSCNSGPVSPYLGFVNQGTFKPNFESFSFSAHRGQPNVPNLEPPSPLVGPTDTRFPDSSSSIGDSDSEAEPVTPCDAVFSENVHDTPKMQSTNGEGFEANNMLVDSGIPAAVM